MIYKEFLPHYLSIGVEYDRFMDGCPKTLEPFDLAHRKSIQEQDVMAHMWWGSYGISALVVAIDHCFNGRSARSEYTEELVTDKIYGESKKTDDELQKQRELFLAKLLTMQANFELSKENESL